MRLGLALHLPIAPLLALAAPAVALAQDAADDRVREMIANARDTYAVPRKLSRCEENADPNEIVVCARDDSDNYRVPSGTDEGSTDTGVPHADVGYHPPHGNVASVRGCFLQKCPPSVYLIDLSTIPMAPPGSDADKIAKGEMRAP